jgi:hypothetical protein
MKAQPIYTINTFSHKRAKRGCLKIYPLKLEVSSASEVGAPYLLLHDSFSKECTGKKHDYFQARARDSIPVA